MIDSVEAGERLVLRWTDGAVTELTWLWVRDHSHDHASRHPVTSQRLIDPLDLDPAERPTRVRVVDGVVVVEWADGSPASELPLGFLREIVRVDREPPGPSRRPWDADSIDVAPISHAAVLADDGGLRGMLDQVHRLGFALIDGVPTTIDAAGSLIRRIGYVRETIFGGLWDFTADLARADTAYTPIALRPHTDGTYSNDAPGLQLLLCLAFDGTGGETVLVDGFHVAECLHTDDPLAFDTLASTPVTGRYVGDGAMLQASRPPIRTDRSGNVVQISFNTADRAPFHLAPDDTDHFYAALRAFARIADDPASQWRHALRPGQAVLFDNWRILHGRTAFTGHRHMCGGYVNREDYESRRRLLATRDQPGGNETGT